MQFHISGLTAAQLKVLKKTGQSVNRRNFYLAGGTAISIYFGHRRSVDLDWFTPQTFGDPVEFAQILRDEGLPFLTGSTDRGTLHGEVDNVQISFLEYRYAMLQPLTFWEEGNCYLASLDDLACMKLAAVAQRGSRKDFIDVYTLAQKHKSLPELLALYQKKYQTENTAPVLIGLAYFDEAEDEPDPALWSTDWREVKRQISEWVRGI